MVKLSFLLSLLVLVSCRSREESNADAAKKVNPVAGKVYEFEDFYSLEGDGSLNLSDMVFIDDHYFVATHLGGLSQTFLRGKYYIQDSIVILQFEQKAYSIYIPVPPATSVVDTNEFRPVISKNTMTLPDLKFVFSEKGTTLTSDVDVFATARKSLEFQLSDYLNGLAIYDLEYFTNMKTLDKVGVSRDVQKERK